MEKRWPAVQLSRCDDAELVLATVDDARPTAIEETADGLRIYFTVPAARDAALSLLAAAGYPAAPIEVSDENWAERSQADLRPVTAGRFTVFPDPSSLIPDPFSILIPPSTAFGTGHHATTRLCLLALQRLDLRGRHVLDVGTGSGVLAIAAARLGAAAILGIDNDADAVRTARENVHLNKASGRVRVEAADLRTLRPLPVDVVVANLTGALVAAAADALTAAVVPGGYLVVSGLVQEERDQVLRSLGAATPVWQDEEDGWAVLVINRPVMA